jgi:hypothetical protein
LLNPSNLAKMWDPIVGETAQEFIQGIHFLDETGRQKVISTSLRILARGSSPSDSISRKSVLVLGEVQSGKTLSFTTVIALSRDNRIPIAVLLAGTKRPLMKQTYSQLVEDLTANSSGSVPRWFITANPVSADRAAALAALQSWKDPITPWEYRQSVVLVAMKTPAGIRKVATYLNGLQKELDQTIPCLVIDDEGDQASPNTKVAQNEFSATYSAISDLRDALPNHSFLSYTATPEANLLLTLTDHLSPESIVVLEPGDTYIGGYKLFVDQSTRFAVPIPDSEIQVATNPSPQDTPPLSLAQSLAYFLVALTIAQKRDAAVKPLSMLIHPASAIDSHNRYRFWVKSIIGKWKMHFEENDPGSSSYRTTSEFRNAIKEITKTVDLQSVFPGLSAPQITVEILKLVRYWICGDHIELRVVNSERSTNNILREEWANHPGWIVIGAGKLDRGFVVKNLAVTYMPRGIGGGNVDTIQQRGRFFGHKSSYLELLRGWFSNDLIESYVSIVETEKAMRDDLKKYDDGNRDLREWRRQMIMGAALRPTRHNIISLDHTTLDLSDNSWFQQKQIFDPALVAMSRPTREEIVALMSNATPTSLDTRNVSFKHLATPIPLPALIALLIDWPITADERQVLDKYLVAFSTYAKTQAATDAKMYFINQLHPRKRSAAQPTKGIVRKHWKIQNLQEGRRTSAGVSYAGDASIRSDDAITVQIHSVIPREDMNDAGSPDCLAIAISWPNGFSRRVLQQD